MKENFADVLDFFVWGLEVFSRSDCGLILAGVRQCKSDRQAGYLLNRLERRHWIMHEGHGAEARFAVTAAGAKQITALEVEQHWNAPWDKKWRLFTYDLPEKRRAERVLLWRALHAHKIGLLQRSVWVWPHPVETILDGILQATGVPECFCGFVCERLFLCSDMELASASWNFPSVNRCHQDYLAKADGLLASLQAARDLQQVARVAAVERVSYERAFSLDPLLPRPLWPPSYQGPEVEKLRIRFRSQLRCQIRDLVT